MADILKQKPSNKDTLTVSSNVNYDDFTSRFALENANIGVYDLHLDTNYVHYSKEAKIILGFEDDKPDPFDWKKIIHPEDLDRLLKRVQNHFSGKIPYYKSEHRIVCKNGNHKWVEDVGCVVERDASGNPLRMIGTLSNITERKEREESMAQNLNVITNQNSRLHNFAHIVTHNLKEYAGNFESLLEFYQDAETDLEKTELIAHLKTVAESLSKTIINLSEVVSKQFTKKIERENIYIYECIEVIATLLRLEIIHKKAIINNNVDPRIAIYANRSYLESIIQNLATNALKYSHPDRTPIITIESHLSEIGILTISLTDNGLGIDLDKYGKDIFGLYRTFHGNENAEGVGLYLTKSQIETLGGSIAVSSEINVGTTFTITMNIQRNPT